jgi:hypothetical protein
MDEALRFYAAELQPLHQLLTNLSLVDDILL